MKHPGITKRKIMKYREGELTWQEDVIVTEVPITVKLNETEIVTLLCTPEHVEDLIIGYLISEKVIKKMEDIEHIRYDETQGFVHVKATRINPLFHTLQNKRYITSCCGQSRQSFVFALDALAIKSFKQQKTPLHLETCFGLMHRLQEEANIFRITGGVHNAALCENNGMVLHRMDIGRHNALDKIYGYCMRNNISVHNKYLVFSGRISSEILLKVAKIGCQVILSKSAPTERALDLAQQIGITTIGFIRDNSLNIYTCPERII